MGILYTKEQVDEAVRRALEQFGNDGKIPVSNGGTGAATAEGALAALGAGVRPNLGVNCDFRRPINQRGQTTYTTVSGPTNIYTLDMWQTASGGLTVNVKNGYLELVGTIDIWFLQKLDPDCVDILGQTVTVSVLHVDGRLDTITKTVTDQMPLSNNGAAAVGYLDGLLTFGIHGGAETLQIRAVKIEFGESQTLAYQNKEEKWILLNQPEQNHTIQLLKCQKYLQLYSSSDNRPTFAIDCRPQMRIDPTQTTIQINGVTYYVNDANL